MCYKEESDGVWQGNQIEESRSFKYVVIRRKLSFDKKIKLSIGDHTILIVI